MFHWSFVPSFVDRFSLTRQDCNFSVLPPVALLLPRFLPTFLSLLMHRDIPSGHSTTPLTPPSRYRPLFHRNIPH
ncbi:hypothetical protein Pmani_011917 [Petrolisthes manimaculis]|uniref:Uncharacterized protein n=1 Tax=Petrolisthes manimaculis TaxID=1843537 RepID=A0AAE1Q078_9EUCA|nr:hypothetical protein Pmani_011917 [Petrolisthes manimaculis]